MVAELGNARLLTMQGDGHCAYGGNSACIDAAVEAYLVDGTLPNAGTVCEQDVPFAQPEMAAALASEEARMETSSVLAAPAAPSLERTWAMRGR
jgi:hypothetical protein